MNPRAIQLKMGNGYGKAEPRRGPCGRTKNSSNVVNQMKKARYLKRHRLALREIRSRSWRMKSIEKGEALNQSPLNHVRQRGGKQVRHGMAGGGDKEG